MKFLIVAFVLAVVTIQTHGANVNANAAASSASKPAPQPAVQASAAQQNAPKADQAPSAEDYKQIVEAAMKKCKATNDELINLQNKNFDSTKSETWCFAAELCMETKHCNKNGDLNVDSYVAQVANKEDEKPVREQCEKCIKESAGKSGAEKTYRQLACMLKQ